MSARLPLPAGVGLLLAVTLLASLSSAEEFRGKVVGVADWDTISVLYDGRV